MAKYILDIEKLMKWVASEADYERSSSNETVYITGIDDNDIDTISDMSEEGVTAIDSHKEMTIKTDANSEQLTTMRYNLVNQLLAVVFGTDEQYPINGPEDMKFSDSIAFSTLLANGFIKEDSIISQSTPKVKWR